LVLVWFGFRPHATAMIGWRERQSAYFVSVHDGMLWQWSRVSSAANLQPSHKGVFITKVILAKRWSRSSNSSVDSSAYRQLHSVKNANPVLLEDTYYIRYNSKRRHWRHFHRTIRVHLLPFIFHCFFSWHVNIFIL
jgi:hypothetical protein